MQTATIRLLDRLSATLGNANDSELARRLSIKPSAVSNYRHGTSRMSDDVAIRAAKLLNLDAVHVVAELHEERAATDAEKRLWRRVRETLTTAALLALLVVSISFSSPATASIATGHNAPGYTLCEVVVALTRRWFARLRSLLTALITAPTSTNQGVCSHGA